MANAKRRKLVAEDLDRGHGATTIPTDSGGTRAASLVGIHTLLGECINCKDAGAVGDGVTDDRTRLNTLANTTIASTGGTIVFPAGTYKLSSNITFPSNATLWFADGAKLSVDSGVTATINGPVQAPLSQIFSGSGTVSFGDGGIREGYPQWWGAVLDGSTDATTALSASVTALKRTIVTEGALLVSSTVTLPEGADLIGMGYGSQIKCATQSSGFPAVYCSDGHNVIRGLRFVGVAEDQNESAAIRIGLFDSPTAADPATNVAVENCTIDGFLDGICISSGSAIRVINNRINGTYAHGIRFADTTDSIIAFNRITGAGNGGNGDGIKGIPSAFGGFTDAVESNDDVLIYGNVISGSSRDGIDVASPFNGLRIEGNICRGNTLNGIEIKDVSDAYDNASYGDSTNLAIADNDVHDNSAAGIRVDGIVNVDIEGNRVRENATNGILLVNGTVHGRVHGNTVDTNTQSGIRLIGNATLGNVAYMDISGNHVVNNGNETLHGIHVDDRASEITIRQNSVYSTNSETNVGILVDTTNISNIQVFDNWVPATLVDSATPISMGTVTGFMGVNRMSASGAPVAFVADDTTPVISGNNGIYITANTTTTSITEFDSAPTDVAPFTIIINDANTRFTYNASKIVLSGAADWTTAAAGDTITFIKRNSIAYEVTRSVNNS